VLNHNNLAIVGREEQESSNWHAEERECLEALEEMLGGEVDLEDDVFVELDLKVELVVAPLRWRLLAHYVNQRPPNFDRALQFYSHQIFSGGLQF
jgi:hypothetical protein